MKRLSSMLFISSLFVCQPGVAMPGGPDQALLAATASGRMQSLQDQLATGADANAKNAAGRPALVIAAYHGNVRTARALLAAGAGVNGTDAEGNTSEFSASIPVRGGASQ